MWYDSAHRLIFVSWLPSAPHLRRTVDCPGWSVIFSGDDFSCCCYCCQVAPVVSDPVRPHKRQPTRLPRPWDSPDKNTGVGFHFLLQCMKVKSESEVAQSCPTLRDPMVCSLPGPYVRRIFQAGVLEWVAIAFSDYHCHRSNPDSHRLVLVFFLNWGTARPIHLHIVHVYILATTANLSSHYRHYKAV